MVMDDQSFAESKRNVRGEEVVGLRRLYGGRASSGE
jgi:hypothetical protein